MQARQDLLDDLYRRDGRDRRHHPFYGLYSGLWAHWTDQDTNDSNNAD